MSDQTVPMLFALLDNIHSKPKVFEFYTAADLWTDEHISAQMLKCHLDENSDLASRNKDFIDRSVAWLVTHLGIQPGTSLADFGCGPGLYTSRLAKIGAQVTGIDFSSRSIGYARSQAAQMGLSIDYFIHNYLDFDTDRRFDVILLIYCDLCALSPEQRSILLRKFASFLKPDGKVVLDVHSLALFEKCQESTLFQFNQFDGFWSARPYYSFQNTFKYPQEQVTLDKYTLIEPDRLRTIYNWLQYFSVDTLKQEFRQAGLEITEVYADVAGKPYDNTSNEFAVVARKLKD